jgi:pSer/pThr/pTyr-binding forkhead associated (FHA) protein
VDPQAAPHLFAPPQPPVRLARDRACVLGRGTDCGLQIPSREASRNHAEVRFEDGRYVVRDLGSTNGTFVNGERVEGTRALSPGDRIEIGGFAVTFCEVEPGLDLDTTQVASARPAAAAKPAGGEGLHGDLAEIPAFALLQMLEAGRKTGVLAVVSDAAEGCIWLEEGMPVHAEAGRQLGFDAAAAIARATSGRFAFEVGSAAPARTIRASVQELLMAATRNDGADTLPNA